MPEVTEYDDATRKLTELVELISYEPMIYVTLVRLGGAHASELVTRTGFPGPASKAPWIASVS